MIRPRHPIVSSSPATASKVFGLFALMCLALLPAYGAVERSASDHYRYDTPSRDGIGKFYMGREISHVMGHRGAGWLERAERVQEERTDLLLNLLPLSQGDTVADIGAGTGYFSLPIAKRIGDEGRVLAVDIQPEMLAIIQQRAAHAGLGNIERVLATETDPKLPEGAVDTVLLVDAYHEFSHPREVMERIVAALSPTGKVILVEYRGEDPRVPIKRLHKMTVAQAERELAAVGLELERVEDALPMQHIMVFTPTQEQER